MTTTAYGPCVPWVNPADVSLCDAGDLDPDLFADAFAGATAILYVKTQRAFPGVCVDTWRPLVCSCGCAQPVLCTCKGYPWIELRNVRAIEVCSVTVDGAILPDSAWVLGDPDDPKQAGKLFRVDGQTWPTCQDIALGADQPGTWQIVYAWGQEPPPGGQVMAQILGCELVKAFTGGKCRLPRHITTISRENFTASVIADPMDIIATGLTGITEVDEWIAALNPSLTDREPTVLNPDLMGMGHDPTNRVRGDWPVAGWRPGPGTW